MHLLRSTLSHPCIYFFSFMNNSYGLFNFAAGIPVIITTVIPKRYFLVYYFVVEYILLFLILFISFINNTNFLFLPFSSEHEVMEVSYGEIT